jgi:hypothetical protein
MRLGAQLIRSRPQTRWLRRLGVRAGAIALLAAATVLVPGITGVQAASADGSSCGASINPIVCENEQPGTPDSVWDLPDGDAGDPTIQGFATDISVNAGNTISFKIDTDARAYTINIYRLGYYGGDGARHIATVTPSARLPQTQPACATDPSTSLYDCGTWSVSASWGVPSIAVSGVYLADLMRTDTGGMSQVPFIVRNDSSHAAIAYQTSDETWEAYNRYGGSDFYTGNDQNLWDSPTRAREVSYNRPFTTRGDNGGQDYLFSNEYPTIRFLEENGYDVTYIADMDTDRYGATLLHNHKVFMSVGHDEYWSQQQRTNVENARDAGVSLMFLSGNEVYWHTRFAASIDGSNTAYRTLTCYKETWDNAATDPSGESTATWRDPRFAAAPGGSNPENALTGTMFEANLDDLALTVTKQEAQDRIWRNTGLSSMTGAQTALAPHTVGFESDEDVDNGFRPMGQIDMSTTTGQVTQELNDFGNTTPPGTTTHHITLYRAKSGALVFGAGTIQWGWGLDADHDGNLDGTPADPHIQQATVNMLADMGAKPSTIMAGLVQTTPSIDTQAPTSTITSPKAAAAIANGTNLTVTGTASDTGGGVVAGVEVSIDGGKTWHPAIGTTSWSYSGVIYGNGAVQVESRATDDSVNTETSKPGVTANVSCPCTLFGQTIPGTTPGVGSGTSTLSVADSGDGGAYELGTSFTSSNNGEVTGIRFYKSAANTGTHIGTLWSSSGQVLATGTFTNETAIGWQTLTFASPVSISANTTYVVSYWDPNGHYAVDENFFYYRNYTAGPLQAAANIPSNQAVNGFFISTHSFPTQSFDGSSYYVDPVFMDAASAPPLVTGGTPSAGASAVATSTSISAVFNKDMTASSVSFTVTDSAGNTVAGTTSYTASTDTAAFTPAAALSAGTEYSISVTAKDTSGRAMVSPATWRFTTAFATNACPCTMLGDSWTPTIAAVSDSQGVELGVKFAPATNGVVTGVRFYKGTGNTGAHVGSLWSAAGTLLGSATFTSESSTGWQTVSFAHSISVSAGTIYVAGYYAPSGNYADTDGAFTSAGGGNFPLSVPAQGGAYSYGSSSTFPSSASTSNYGVDVIFAVPASVVPAAVSEDPAPGSTNVSINAAIQVSLSDSVRKGTYTVTVSGPGGAVQGSASLDASQRVVTFTPAAPLANAATYSVQLTGAQSLSGTPQAGPITWSFSTAGAGGCPCTLFGSSAHPTNADSGEASAVNLGVRFVPANNGYITGIRFYKAPANTGTHTGSLWSASGTQLATGTFSNEAASGWQTLTFSSAVPVTAGTTYVASYLAPNGHYSADGGYFASTYTNGTLSAPAGANGVYAYGSSTAFPSASYNSTNYWVDPIFNTTNPGDTTPPTVVSTTPGSGASNVATTTDPSATFSEAITTSSLVFTLKGGSGNSIAGSLSYDSNSKTATFTPTSQLSTGTSYTASVAGSDPSGNAMAQPVTWTFTTGGTCPCTLFASNAVPANVDSGDPAALNIGVRFTPSANGSMTGLRFYKAVTNTGTHVGTLWAANGTSLATVTFTGETASGWQTASFAAPVAVTAGTTYTVSYFAPNGHYSYSGSFFGSVYTNGPLTAPAGSNGVYAYGSATSFPSASYNNTNYWVDPIFTTGSSGTSTQSARSTLLGLAVAGDPFP